MPSDRVITNTPCLANAGFVFGNQCTIDIISALTEPDIWQVSLLKTEGERRTVVLYASGHDFISALKDVHLLSAMLLKRYVKNERISDDAIADDRTMEQLGAALATMAVNPTAVDGKAKPDASKDMDVAGKQRESLSDITFKSTQGGSLPWKREKDMSSEIMAALYPMDTPTTMNPLAPLASPIPLSAYTPTGSFAHYNAGDEYLLNRHVRTLAQKKAAAKMAAEMARMAADTAKKAAGKAADKAKKTADAAASASDSEGKSPSSETAVAVVKSEQQTQTQRRSPPAAMVTRCSVLLSIILKDGGKVNVMDECQLSVKALQSRVKHIMRQHGPAMFADALVTYTRDDVSHAMVSIKAVHVNDQVFVMGPGVLDDLTVMVRGHPLIKPVKVEIEVSWDKA